MTCIAAGVALLLAAWLLWEARDLGPSWAAQSVIATVEFATTAERDDARITRAYESARQRLDIDAQLEPLPSQTKVRHTQLSVRAPSTAAAIAQATAMAEAMRGAFAGDGSELSVNIRHRTIPVPDSTTAFLGNALRTAAGVAGILGIALIAFGWFSTQAGPRRLPARLWAPVAGAVVLAFAPLLLPGRIFVALLIVAMPVLIACLILRKTMQLRETAGWPSARARIVKSEIRAEHRRHAGDVTQVVNVPHLEYEFRLGDRVIRGSRVGLGDAPDSERTLNAYPVGVTVPVYYNPKNPEEALLERDPPFAIVWLYLSAAFLLVTGFAVLVFLANGSAIVEALEARLPEGAFLPGMGFFSLGGLLVLGLLWGARRQSAEAAEWPVTGGHVVSSTVEHYRARVGGARSGTLVTLYEPVIEYAYRVNGREYHSTQISFGGKVAGSEELAQAGAARYAQGSDVVVRYDPQNPSNAVLDLKIANAIPFLIIALVFFGLALFFSGLFG